MPGGSEFKPVSIAEEIRWWSACFVAARAYGVEPSQVMFAGGKARRAAAHLTPARRAALYLANVAGNMNAHALARASGMRRPTIRHHLAAVEDDREFKAELDAVMDQLTALLREGFAEAGRAVGGQVYSDDYLIFRFCYESASVAELAGETGLHKSTIYMRLKAKGVTPDGGGPGRGDDNLRTRIRDEAIPDVLARISRGDSAESVANAYRVSVSAIRYLISGKRKVSPLLLGGAA